MASTIHSTAFPIVGRSRARNSVGVRFAFALCAFFLIANVYDMQGTDGVKYASFALLVPCALFGFRKAKLGTGAWLGFGAMFLAWPLIGWVLGLAGGAVPALATGDTTLFLGFFAALAIAPLMGPARTCRVLYRVAYSMAIAIIAITMMIALGLRPNIINNLSTYISAYTTPYPGNFLGALVRTRVYFEATLWLVPATVYFVFVRKYLPALICLLALVLASSRAGVLVALAFIAVAVFVGQGSRLVKILVVVLALAGGLYFFPTFGRLMGDAFKANSEQAGLSIRTDQFGATLELLANEPSVLLVGQGAGMKIFSPTSGEWVVRLEEDHADAIRKHGLIWFLAFTWLCGVVAMRLWHSSDPRYQAHAMAFVAMYIAAGSNPQLMSPLFMFYLAALYLLSRPSVPARARVASRRQRPPNLAPGSAAPVRGLAGLAGSS